MSYAATFENVEKQYRQGLWSRTGLPAVRPLQLQIPTGSTFGLLGPNRAGKTTLVKMLLSLTRPTAGQLTRLGEPVQQRRTLARVGYMHENHAFPRYLNAREVLTFYGGLSGLRTSDLKPRVQTWLERVGLADRADEPIHRFSKGMVQRLGLAQAMINDPELLVLDEPTEGLDLLGRGILREILRELNQAGRTVLLVSHALPELEEVCDELAVLVAGQLAYRGSLNELIGPVGPQRRSLEAALRALYQPALNGGAS